VGERSQRGKKKNAQVGKPEKTETNTNISLTGFACQKEGKKERIGRPRIPAETEGAPKRATGKGCGAGGEKKHWGRRIAEGAKGIFDQGGP